MSSHFGSINKDRENSHVWFSYFEAIRVLLSEGWTPKRTVHMSFVAGELPATLNQIDP